MIFVFKLNLLREFIIINIDNYKLSIVKLYEQLNSLSKIKITSKLVIFVILKLKTILNLNLDLALTILRNGTCYKGFYVSQNTGHDGFATPR